MSSDRWLLYSLLIRDAGARGTVFAVLFRREHQDNFKLSKLHIGDGFTFVDPVHEGEMGNAVILSTCQPCLPGAANWLQYIPSSLLTPV